MDIKRSFTTHTCLKTSIKGTKSYYHSTTHLPNLQTLGRLGEADHVLGRAHLHEREVRDLGQLGRQRCLAAVGWAL